METDEDYIDIDYVEIPYKDDTLENCIDMHNGYNWDIECDADRKVLMYNKEG